MASSTSSIAPSPLYASRRPSSRSPPGYYRPSGQGDVFLFSPTLCSRSSHDSSTHSATSFDTLAYASSPTDRPSRPRLFSPSAASGQSPLFVEAYLSGSDPKPVARLSPSTPFHELFNSSPAGYWNTTSLSVSPISRHSSVPAVSLDADPADDQSESEQEVSHRKIESLLEYNNARNIPDSPRRFSSPSSLSSLSSIPSSPSLFSGIPPASSQTSCSPSVAHGGLMSSPLGSPFKPTANSGSTVNFVRRSRRVHVPVHPSRRTLASDILNQLGANHRFDSPSKITSSPMAPCSDSDDENYVPLPDLRGRSRGSRAKPTVSASRKRTRPPSPPPASGSRAVDSSALPLRRDRKRRRKTAAVSALPAGSSSRSATIAAHLTDIRDDDEEIIDADAPVYPQRTFPLRIPKNDMFLLFYRRFPVSSVMDPGLAAAHNIAMLKVSDAIANSPRDVLDLYTPRFVKGKGTAKVGLCPICHESVARGGEGKKLWLSMKFSAFKCYHMQYAHGISATTGLPFSPPTAFRTVRRPNPGKHEKSTLREGRCHRCTRWVPVEGIKDVPTKVREIFWWKHAATCHQGSTIDGEADVFVEDAVYAAVTSAGSSSRGGNRGRDSEEDADSSEADEAYL